jgi:hypothetical protein
MANPLFTNSASCTPYAAAQAAASPEPPELDYRLFSPEFLDELEEHYAAMAVGTPVFSPTAFQARRFISALWAAPVSSMAWWARSM